MDSRPGSIGAGSILWEPSPDIVANANVTKFIERLAKTRGLQFDGYRELWQWSVDDLEAFWGSIWEFFEVIEREPYSAVLAKRRMPGAQWFPGAQLNYAQHALRRRDDHPALLFKSERDPLTSTTYGELYVAVAAVAHGLRRLGVRKGDRVAAYLPNVPETVVAVLATASIGAVWSACSPEFGTRSVIERFQQIQPRVLLAVDGYQYRGRAHDRMAAIAEIEANLPTLEQTVVLPYLVEDPDRSGLPGSILWAELARDSSELVFEAVPFDHPLWVLYSSGTTGLPKPIVHGHGGILLEHLKTISLHMDITPDDRFLWFTTTGWMMWNFLIGGLLLGATVQLYDGDPVYPDMGALWALAEKAGVTYFGASAPYIQANMQAGTQPGKTFDLSRLRGLGSTGAPLSPEGFEWVYDNVNRDIHLGSFSGGTDLCTGFVGPSPLLPVRAGEIQACCLGAKVEAFDPDGRPVVDEVGELVITDPMPSMPLYFWGDEDGSRYRGSYFTEFPDVWRHGDWIRFTDRGSCVITGRSDSTLNRGGIRMGTSEFYSVVEEMDGVVDSLVVDTGSLITEGLLLLFVVMNEGTDLDDSFHEQLASRLRTHLSPRHVPDQIHTIPEVPRTLNGKKVEVPVKKILMGESADVAISRDALSNPGSIGFFEALAGTLDPA